MRTTGGKGLSPAVLKFSFKDFLLNVFLNLFLNIYIESASRAGAKSEGDRGSRVGRALIAVSRMWGSNPQTMRS